MIKKIILLLVILIVLKNTIFCDFVFADQKTIKELTVEVKNIENSKNKQITELQNIKKNLFIDVFLKSKIFKTEDKKINKLVIKYKETKDLLNEKIKKTKKPKKLIKKLLNNEKNIYKDLLPYTKKEKYEEYKSFVKKNLEILNKKVILEKKQENKEKIIKTKISKIKKKIIQHNKIINKKINEIINKKINEKLEIFINKEKFKKLKNSEKNLIFEKMLKKLWMKLTILNKNQEKNQKKIMIYKIIIEKIKIYKNNLIKVWKTIN